MITQTNRQVFPFTAIVGQEEIKLALLLNVVDPKIGGVIVIGDRGTGKSTTVRALVDLLPYVEVVENDPFLSHPTDLELISEEVRQRKRAGEEIFVERRKIPIIDLPLGATEDRVCGTIDIEKALREGTKDFEPGLAVRGDEDIIDMNYIQYLEVDTFELSNTSTDITNNNLDIEFSVYPNPAFVSNISFTD